jgi:hypothetical protein
MVGTKEKKSRYTPDRPSCARTAGGSYETTTTVATKQNENADRLLQRQRQASTFGSGHWKSVKRAFWFLAHLPIIWRPGSTTIQRMRPCHEPHSKRDGDAPDFGRREPQGKSAHYAGTAQRRKHPASEALGLQVAEQSTGVVAIALAGSATLLFIPHRSRRHMEIALQHTNTQRMRGNSVKWGVRAQDSRRAEARLAPNPSKARRE